MPKRFRITTVYARCNATERLKYWDAVENIVGDCSRPWMVGVILMLF